MQWRCTSCLCIMMTAATGLLRIAPHSLRPAAAGARWRKGRQQGQLQGSAGRRCCTSYCCTLLGWRTRRCETTGHSCGGCCGGGLGSGSDCRGIIKPNLLLVDFIRRLVTHLCLLDLNHGRRGASSVFPCCCRMAGRGRHAGGLMQPGCILLASRRLSAASHCCCTFWACGKGFPNSK